MRVDPHREPRRVRGLGELVQHLARRERLRVDQVEGVPVDLVVREMRDVVDSAGHEVHWHEVHLLALGPGEREPLGERVAEALDQLEEVVRPVDLVHLAGHRVPDDDPRPVDAERRLHLLTHELLRLELRGVVGVRELLALVEHVLAEESFELPGDGDRAGVVEAPDVGRVRELDHVASAFDVRVHVVDRGEMEEVIDLLVEAVDAEALLGKVSGDGYETVAGAKPLGELVQAAARALPHERVDRAVALEQLLHEVASDEPGCASHEVVHGSCLSLCIRLRARVYPAAELAGHGLERASFPALVRNRGLRVA